ncbi:MAG TPA: thioredoxin domain-containing protein, partial [Chloroflexota bacterium]
PKDVFDNATPSGNSVAADVLLRLALLIDRSDFREAAESALRLLREPMASYPLAFARALNALDFFLAEPKEIAIVGDAEADDTRALLRAVFEPFLPNKVVAGGGAQIPLLEGREPRDGRALAYVCEHYVCQAPTSEPEELRRLIS